MCCSGYGAHNITRSKRVDVYVWSQEVQKRGGDQANKTKKKNERFEPKTKKRGRPSSWTPLLKFVRRRGRRNG